MESAKQNRKRLEVTNIYIWRNFIHVHHHQLSHHKPQPTHVFLDLTLLEGGKNAQPQREACSNPKQINLLQGLVMNFMS